MSKEILNSFTQEEGDIHLGGIDALVRLTLDQVRTDVNQRPIVSSCQRPNLSSYSG